MAVARQSGPVVAENVFDTCTASTTVSSGSDRLLVCRVSFETAANAVSGIVFNTSETFTKLDHSAASSFSRVEIWYLVNPTVTTANVVATSAGSIHWAIAVEVFTGADQTTPLETAAKGSADSGTSTSRTATGFASGEWTTDMLSLDSTGHTPTVESGDQTADFATGDYGAGTNEYVGSSNTTDGGMGWTWTTSCPNSHIAAVINAAGAPPISDAPEKIRTVRSNLVLN